MTRWEHLILQEGFDERIRRLVKVANTRPTDQDMLRLHRLASSRGMSIYWDQRGVFSSCYRIVHIMQFKDVHDAIKLHWDTSVEDRTIEKAASRVGTKLVYILQSSPHYVPSADEEDVRYYWTLDEMANTGMFTVASNWTDAKKIFKDTKSWLPEHLIEGRLPYTIEELNQLIDETFEQHFGWLPMQRRPHATSLSTDGYVIFNPIRLGWRFRTASKAFSMLGLKLSKAPPSIVLATVAQSAAIRTFVNMAYPDDPSNYIWLARPQ